jgi:uncharacterized protein
MNQARGAQEPTMEEILSSIRRIISEDGKRVGDGAAEAPAAAEPAPVAPLSAVASAAEPQSEADDVLELTEVAPDEPAEPEPLELVEEVAAPTLAEPQPEIEAEPEPEPLPEPMALQPAMEPVPEPAPVPRAEPVPPPTPVPPPVRAALAPVPEPELEPEPPREPEPELEAEIEIQAEPEPEAEPDVEDHPEPLEVSVSPRAPDSVGRPAPGPLPQPPMEGGSRLMSEATAIASSAALSVLAQVVQPGRGFTEEGRRLVDQIMRERLEVHLRDWMDANLPALVERIVREEIAGLVARSLGRSS